MSLAHSSFLSLHAQLVSALRNEIIAGTWDSWLPDERSLAHQFHVSRTTMRAALKSLETENLLVTRLGVGREVVKSIKDLPTPTPKISVGLLSPKPLSMLQSSYSRWAGELRSLLFEHSMHLEFHTGDNYINNRASRALPMLVSRYSHSCWILLLSSKVTQKWFAESKTPCVLAGSCHEGIDLPSLDGDQQAKCRHAVGVLIANGHSRISFLHAQKGAGEDASERGFLEGIAKSSRKDIKGEIVMLPQEFQDICRKTRAILSTAERPTALLISNPHHFMAVISMIWRMGLKIPDDISVISRDHESFMNYITPQPAYYIPKASSYAEKLLSLIHRVIDKDPNPNHHLTIPPEFFKGQTIAKIG